jgi:hypothetical protein
MDQLRKIDFNHNGALDAGGEFRAYLDLEKLTGELDSKKQAKVGYLQSDIALRGNIPFDQLAEEEEQQATGCESGQGLYLRRDKLDVSIYNQSIDESAAEGATISYTNNSEDDTDTAEIQALAAWVFARNPCVQRPVGLGVTRPFVSAYAFALSVLADGNLTNDRKTEKSALKPGLDAQIEIASGPLDLQALTVSLTIRPTSGEKLRPMEWRLRGNRTNWIGASAALIGSSRPCSISFTNSRPRWLDSASTTPASPTSSPIRITGGGVARQRSAPSFCRTC